MNNLDKLQMVRITLESGRVVSYTGPEQIGPEDRVVKIGVEESIAIPPGFSFGEMGDVFDADQLRDVPHA